MESGVAYNVDGHLQAGMGMAVADYDGNGFLDIAKTNFSGDLPSLYANDGGLFFKDVSQPAGLGNHELLGWGIAFLDVDEDGWKDLVIANGHVYPEVDHSPIGETLPAKDAAVPQSGQRPLRRDHGSAGPAFEHARPARGLAIGDLDGDGRPEIVIVNMNDTPSLLKNPAPRRQCHCDLRWRGPRRIAAPSARAATVDAGGPQADRRSRERRQLLFAKRAGTLFRLGFGNHCGRYRGALAHRQGAGMEARRGRPDGDAHGGIERYRRKKVAFRPNY